MSLYHSQPGILAKAACNRRGVRTEYRGIIFKSKSEAGRAMELDGLGYHWQYEPAAFEYVGDDGFKHRYTPDFWVDELKRYEEVKGWFPERDRRKIELFVAQNPNVPLVIIRSFDLSPSIIRQLGIDNSQKRLASGPRLFRLSSLGYTSQYAPTQPDRQYPAQGRTSNGDRRGSSPSRNQTPSGPHGRHGADQ